MVKTTRIRSTVWKHFRKTALNLVTCNYCESNLKYHGNTSNMREHLKRKHANCMEDAIGDISIVGIKNEVVNDNNSTYDDFIDYNTSYDIPTEEFEQSSSNFLRPDSPSTSDGEPNAKRQRTDEVSEKGKDEVDLQLVRMLVTDFQPLSFVENVGFKHLVGVLHPLYTLPTRKELSNVILPKIYKTTEDVLKTKLEKVKNVSLSVEIWSADSNRTYMTVTTHFILDDTLNSKVLETRQLDFNNSSEDIANELRTIINKWNLQEKISTIVTEDAMKIKTAITDNLKQNHQSCIALMLNSVISECFQNNSVLIRIVEKCRSIVKEFKNSRTAAEKLCSIQKQMKLPEMKIKGDANVLSWNSPLLMLERLCEIRIPLTATISALSLPIELLEAHEWDIVGEYINLVRPFNATAEELSSQKYFPLSKIIPMLKNLRAILIMDVRPQNEIITGLHNALIETTGRLLDSLERNGHVAKATFLDHRFKKRGFANPQNADNMERLLKEELTIEIQNSSNQEENLHNHESDPNSIWRWHDELVRNQKLPPPDVRAKNIIQHFLFLPLQDMNKDPFELWANYKQGFPELYRLFLKYNCVPGNCVPSERIFSKIGFSINEKRNHLSGENLNYILFLNANL